MNFNNKLIFNVLLFDLANHFQFSMGNQALSVNPTGTLTTFNLTTNGSNWLWSVFSLMGLSTLVIGFLSTRAHSRERTLYLFNICILTTTSIAYFCMASNLGFAPVEVSQRGPGARQFWYVRYIDWIITSPLIISQILLTAGLPINTILSTMFVDVVMIVCGLIGGLVSTEYKWAFFVFACISMCLIYSIAYSGMKSSESTAGKENRRIYMILIVWIVVFWTPYPIAWALCEGSNVISVTGEMIFYGILDIFTKPGFAFLILILHRNLKKETKRKQNNIASVQPDIIQVEF